MNFFKKNLDDNLLELIIWTSMNYYELKADSRVLFESDFIRKYDLDIDEIHFKKIFIFFSMICKELD